MVSVSHQQEHLSVRVSSAGAGAAPILQAPERFRHDLCQEFNNMQILLDLVNHIVYILFIKFD